MVFLFCFHNTSGEPYTIFNGIKQDLVDFKNEIDSVLKNIKTEIQSKLDDINNRLYAIDNIIKSSINDQVNESMLNIKHYHKCFKWW